MSDASARQATVGAAGPDPGLPPRWGHLAPHFRNAFRGDPSLFVRAPGRVNLIGEHVDYNGLPVLPMALQREVALLLRPREDMEVRLMNVGGEFGERRFGVSSNVDPYATGDWGNYAKAAVQALARLVTRERGSNGGPRGRALRGFEAVLDSDVPVASGLSSSSAVVIATGLATLAANGRTLPLLDMAELMAEAERYTGTRGGGMDQAISLGALVGTATRIAFAPLGMTSVPVPRAWRFVVASSLVRAEKSGGAQAAYNARTRECRQALERVWLRVRGGGEPSYAALVAGRSSRELLAAAEAVLEEPLLRRFRHVVTEAERVDAAEAALRGGDLRRFGALMDASHESLATDYEVSSPVLDALVAEARTAGAAGARLTGAGFGGCVVAVCAREEEDALLARLEDAFYRPRGVEGPLEAHLFPAEAAGGASVSRV